MTAAHTCTICQGRSKMLRAVLRRKLPSPVVGLSRTAPGRGLPSATSTRRLFLRASRCRACSCHFFLWNRSQTSHSSWDRWRTRSGGAARSKQNPPSSATTSHGFQARVSLLKTGHLFLAPSEVKTRPGAPRLLGRLHGRQCVTARARLLSSLSPPTGPARLRGCPPGWFRGPEAAPRFPARAPSAPCPATPPGSPRGCASSSWQQEPPSVVASQGQNPPCQEHQGSACLLEPGPCPPAKTQRRLRMPRSLDNSASRHTPSAASDKIFVRTVCVTERSTSNF